MLERNLSQMLATDDQRPKLKLEQSTVQSLMWPAQKPIPSGET